MHPLLLLSLLMALPVSLVAAEAVPVLAVPDGAPWWAGLVVMAVSTIVLPFVTNYLKKAADAKKAQLDSAVLDRKQRIFLSLQSYALERSASYAERDLVTLAQMIVTKEITQKEKVKEYLKGLGRRLKSDLILYAKDNFTVDLLAEFGDKYVDELIEWAANKVSPFPGRETAVALLQGGADTLLKYGLGKASDYLDAQVSAAQP